MPQITTLGSSPKGVNYTHVVTNKDRSADSNNIQNWFWAKIRRSGRGLLTKNP
jgi:hypothetical protein